MLSLARAPSTLAPPHHFFAISVSAAAVCITLAVLLRWKPLRRLEFIKPWLYLLAGIGFAAAFLTSWANNLAGYANGIPYLGDAVAIMIAIALAYIVCYDLWPRHPSNTLTEISALLLPAFAPAIPGGVGSLLATAISTVAITGGGIIAKGFGV